MYFDNNLKVALFDGINDYIVVSNSQNYDLSGKDWTIETWIKPKDIAVPDAITNEIISERTIITKRTSTNIDFGVLQKTNNELVLQCQGTSNGTGISLTPDEWNHIAVVRSNETITIYKNGTGSYSFNSDVQNSTGDLYIGSSILGEKPYRGYMKDLRITNNIARYTTDFAPILQFPKVISSEQIFSPTSIVEPQFVSGQIISANTSSIQDEDGIKDFSFKWYEGERLIHDATGSSLSVKNNMLLESYIKSEVVITDQNNNKTIKTKLAHRIPKEGLVFHVDGQDPDSIDYENGIWKDLSGYNNHLYWNSSRNTYGLFLEKQNVRTSNIQSTYTDTLKTTTYNSMPTGNTSYTVVAIFRPITSGDNKMIVSFGNEDTIEQRQRAYPIAYDVGRFKGGTSGGHGTWFLSTAGQNVPTTTDYWVVMNVFNGSTEKLYVNGVLDKQAAMYNSIPTSGARNLSIGWPDSYSSYAPNADIGLIALYNRAMNEQEVVDFYNIYKYRFRLDGTRAVTRKVDNRLFKRYAKEGEEFSVDLSTLFHGLDSSSQTHTIKLYNGGTLPEWLSYNSSNYTLSGIPTSNYIGDFKLVVIAQDDNFTFSDCIEINVAPSTQTSVANTHQHYDWTGVDDPVDIISSFSLNSNLDLWSNKFIWEEQPNTSFSLSSELEENFDDESWTGFTRVDWTNVETPEVVATNFSLNGLWSGKLEWSENPVATFSQQADFSENFDDISWAGSTRIDWEGIENAQQYSTDFSLNVLNEIDTLIPLKQLLETASPLFSGPSFTENFDDNTWSGATRSIFTGIEDPANFIQDYSIGGFWEGSYNWANNPEPQFLSTSLLEENFDDQSWTGFTRVDWSNTPNPDNVGSQNTIRGAWEGKFVWNDIPTPGFSEKTSKVDESFEEDWTI